MLKREYGSGKSEMEMTLLSMKWTFIWAFYQFSESLLHGLECFWLQVSSVHYKIFILW